MSVRRVVDKLEAMGRDPLEILFLPLAPDIQAMIDEAEVERRNGWVVNELRGWPDEMKHHLFVMFENKKRNDPAQT